MVTVLKLKGYITEDGEIKVYDMPADHPVGEVAVVVETVPQEEPWTEAELQELLQFKATSKPGSEIAKNEAIGAWADMSITDGGEFIAELRQQEESRRKW